MPPPPPLGSGPDQDRPPCPKEGYKTKTGSTRLVNNRGSKTQFPAHLIHMQPPTFGGFHRSRLPQLTPRPP